MMTLNTYSEFSEATPSEVLAFLLQTQYKYNLGRWENVNFDNTTLNPVQLPVEITAKGTVRSIIHQYGDAYYYIRTYEHDIFDIIVFSTTYKTILEFETTLSTEFQAIKYVREEPVGFARLDTVELNFMGGLITHRNDLKVRQIDYSLYPTGFEKQYISLKKEIPKGGIHVLHGPPGTGKTSVLTNLVQDLEDVRFVYPKIDVTKDLEGLVSFLKDSYNSHVCLIIENGEAIFDKATEEMLNVGDGILSLIGRYNISVLITTNKEGGELIDHMHVAMSRAGRMRSFLLLDYYDETQSGDLQIEHMLSRAPYSLADYYQLKDEKTAEEDDTSEGM